MELIGRDHELAELVRRLAARRLVTVIGPGGIGKTALARAAAEEAGPAFELGWHVVDLSRVDAPDAVAGTLAGQLGFPSFEALVNSPGEQPALVLVDNCEHVTAAAAEAISDLLDACAAPTVLATSRSPLDVPGESLLPVGPLAVPRAGAVDVDVPAVRLFLERATDAGVELEEPQLSAVADLCRELDGMPLALEIAAARTRTMTPAEILTRLRGGSDVLSRPRYRGDARHRSVSATIDWSYRLLDGSVAETFEQLGVFAGPFTATMAGAVALGDDADPAAVADVLHTLVDASLVAAEHRGDTTWYRLLATVRAYAGDRLAQRGRLEEAQDRFADHVVAETLRIMSAGHGGWDATVLAQLLASYDNIAAALRWSVAHDEDSSRSLLLCSVLWGVVHQSHVDDIAALSAEVVDRWPDPTLRFGADAAATRATALYLTGSPREAIELAERALAGGDHALLAPVTLRRVMGQARRALGDIDASIDMFAQAIAEARVRGAVALALECEVFRALVLADVGHRDEALAAVERARAEAQAIGSDINAVWARSAEGYIRLRDDPATARTAITEALATSRRLDYPAGVGLNLRSLALADIASGQLGAAAGVLLELLEELLIGGAFTDLRVALDAAAVVLHRSGRPAWADLAATAEALPVVTLMASVGHELFPLPSAGGRLLTGREAIPLATRELHALVDSPAPAPTAGAVDAVAAGDDGSEAVFVNRGEWWELGFAGRTVHVKASKGLDDLAMLIASPDRELHCLDLVGAGVQESSTGGVIDDKARRQYEQRVRELQAEIDDAERDNDLARAERARIELDTLVDHLTAALGLGARSRDAGRTAERARSAVTQRVRATIRRIGDAHPELGRHLAASVTTGSYCSYRPERPVQWRTRSSR
jgi:predicted ATPase